MKDIPKQETKDVRSQPKSSEINVKEAEFVEVDDSTGEVIEEDDDDAEFREMQDSFFN